MFSQEYIAALVVVITSTAAMFGYTLVSEEISALIIVISGAWVMVRRYKKGDIMATGLRKDENI